MNKQSLRNLQKTIASLVHVGKSKNSIETQLSIIFLCKKYLQNDNSAADEPKVFTENSIDNILKFKKFDVDRYLLKQLQEMNKSQKIPKKVLKAYITMNPYPPSSKILELVKEANDLDLIKTSLRLLLYKYKDYDKAMQLLKESSNFLNKLSVDKFRNRFIRSLLIISGINYSFGFLAGFALSSVTLLELYFVNILLFKSFVIHPLLFSSPYISWLPVTSNWKRIAQYYELSLYSKAAEITKECYYLNVSNYDLQDTPLLKSFISQKQVPENVDQVLIKELRERGFIVIADSKETLYKEYWESGGDEEFEWVEPDRDPVEFIKI